MNITPQHIANTFKGCTLSQNVNGRDTAWYNNISIYNTDTGKMYIMDNSKWPRQTLSLTKIPTTTNQFITLCEIAGIKLQYKTSV